MVRNVHSGHVSSRRAHLRRAFSNPSELESPFSPHPRASLRHSSKSFAFYLLFADKPELPIYNSTSLYNSTMTLPMLRQMAIRMPSKFGLQARRHYATKPVNPAVSFPLDWTRCQRRDLLWSNSSKGYSKQQFSERLANSPPGRHSSIKHSRGRLRKYFLLPSLHTKLSIGVGLNSKQTNYVAKPTVWFSNPHILTIVLTSHQLQWPISRRQWMITKIQRRSQK